MRLDLPANILESNMEHKFIAGIDLSYAPQESEDARIIAAACERSVHVMQQCWGLRTPEDCRVYVMTSWKQFLFDSAPWPWKAYLILTFPFVARRAQAIWPYAGGWSLQYGRRKVVGVKPLYLIQQGNRNLGEQIFLQNRNLQETVQTVTCHELVHAFTFHLGLPTWLHEGLATLAMEHYLDRHIVRDDTLERLTSQGFAHPHSGTERLQVDRQQALIAQYVRGYWLARYLEETKPELLRDLLSKPVSHTAMKGKIASAFGKDPESFWQGIDMELYTRFR